MIKLGSNNIGKIYLGSNSIGKAYLGSDLVFQKGSPSPALPYTPVEYIETDGTAYINTGITGTAQRSATMKILVAESGSQIFLGVHPGSDGNNTMFIMCAITSTSKCYFGYYYYYSSDAPSIADSVANETPFDVKVSLKQSSQSLGVKQAGEPSFTSYSKTQSTAVSNTATMYLFAGCNPSSLDPITKCKAGARVYDRVKIYSDSNYGTLVFDGEPCYYEGEYGLWDHVSDSFKGNAAGSGAFTGPSIQ